MHGVELQTGCRVLAINFRDRWGHRKPRSYWEEEVHVVTVRKRKDSLVYTVGLDRGPRKTRVHHWNSLLLRVFLFVDEVNLEIKTKAKREINIEERREKQTKHREREPDSS